MGMEVSAAGFAVSAGVYLAMRDLRRPGLPWRAPAVLAASTFLRMDLAVPMAAVVLACAAVDRPRWKAHLLWGAGCAAVALSLQEAARVAYFDGEWLPNTWYLKVDGVPLAVRLGAGLYRLGLFAAALNPAIAAVPVVALAVRRRAELALPAAVVAAMAAYSVWVGGDAWEEDPGSRYLATVVPQIALLTLAGWEDALAWASRLAARSAGPEPWWSRGFAAALPLLCLFAWSSGLGGQQLRVQFLASRPSEAGANRDRVGLAHVLERVTRPGARIALKAAGTIPYFTPREFIDLLGKCDPVVAHLPARIEPFVHPAFAFRPGHQKWDYEHSVCGLRPDVVLLAPRELDASCAGDYRAARAENESFLVRRDSDRVVWEDVEVTGPASPPPAEAPPSGTPSAADPGT
jgi:hypothetical protein